MAVDKIDDFSNVLSKALLLSIPAPSILNENSVHRACSIDQIL